MYFYNKNIEILKKVIKLTESDLARIVKRVIKEQQTASASGGAQTPPILSLSFPDGKTYPVKLQGISDQEKLNSFLDWGAQKTADGLKILIDNGYRVNQLYAVKTKGNVKVDQSGKVRGELSDVEFTKLSQMGDALVDSVNLGLSTLSKYISNPSKTDYMPTVYAQIDKVIGPTMSEYDSKKVTDKAIQIKLNEVTNMLSPLSKNAGVGNDDLVNLLQYYELLDELVTANG